MNVITITRAFGSGGDELARLLAAALGWNLLDRDRPNVFHVHLTATLATRVRRVMEYHWVREEMARKLIVRSDAHRCSFCHDGFGADWTDPLEYHLSINSGRLRPLAINAAARAARRHWHAARS
jgi:cytidylate kinase